MAFLEQLKQDPNCLYLYNWGPFIYGLKKDCDEYLAVVSDTWSIPEDWVGEITKADKYGYMLKEDNITYSIFQISYWFDLVLRGNLMCWECACMNKKFVLKEHVKLLMHTDPIQLRTLIDSQRERLFLRLETGKVRIYDFWVWIKNCKFVNQILVNHKIVNFKEANPEYKQLMERSNPDILRHMLLELKDYKFLCDQTDGQLLKSKIQKFLEREKNE